MPPAPAHTALAVAPTPAAAEVDAVAAGINRFALRLLAVSQQHPDTTGNFVVAPSALQQGLLGVQRSAVGATACELATQLELGADEQALEPVLSLFGRALRAPRATLTPDSTLSVSVAAERTPWVVPFAAEQSRPAVFHAPSGPREVVMMHATRPMMLFEHEAFQLLALPLDDVARPRSLVLLLPRSSDGLPQVEALLGQRKLCHWIAAAEHRRVELTLPRLALRAGASLRGALQRLGLRRVFTATEELPGWSRPLADVTHEMRWVVDEHGLGEASDEAPAAAQPTTSTALAARRFSADHPFLMLLRDDESGALLVVARVVSP